MLIAVWEVDLKLAVIDLVSLSDFRANEFRGEPSED